MNPSVQMNYAASDLPREQLLREYGRALARQQREQRAGRDTALPTRVRALVMAAHAVRARSA